MLNAYAETVTEWFYDRAKAHSDVHYHSRALAAAIRAAALYCKRDQLQLLAIADELEGNVGLTLSVDFPRLKQMPESHGRSNGPA